ALPPIVPPRIIPGSVIPGSIISPRIPPSSLVLNRAKVEPARNHRARYDPGTSPSGTLQIGCPTTASLVHAACHGPPSECEGLVCGAMPHHRVAMVQPGTAMNREESA